MTSLGDRLHSLRKSKSLTQEAFASSLNERYDLKINKSMVSKWENNIDTPSLNSVKYMAIFFGVSLDYLLGISDCDQDFPILASAPTDPLQLSEQEEGLVISFRGLNEDGREKAIERVEELLDVPRYREITEKVKEDVLNHLAAKESV
jgi:transcriptional regulator with XRE-family HTH domain